jgi:glycosyltransferase involved in cell wall biosynthesis
MKSVSVVVITYNEEKNIDDCLKSLINQDYPKEAYEIIVVDVSNDKTAELASKYE